MKKDLTGSGVFIIDDPGVLLQFPPRPETDNAMRTNRYSLACPGIAGPGSAFAYFELKSAKAPQLNNIAAHQRGFDLAEKEVYYFADLFAFYPRIVIQGIHNISFRESSRHYKPPNQITNNN
jgi:hypothetical protein